MSSSVPVGALIGWMVLLTVKHIIADFVLQNSWMAIGKDQKTGWALPCWRTAWCISRWP